MGQKCSGREIPKAVRSRIFIIIPFLYSFFLGVIYSIMIDCLEFQLDFLLSRIFLSLVWFQPFSASVPALLLLSRSRLPISSYFSLLSNTATYISLLIPHCLQQRYLVQPFPSVARSFSASYLFPRPFFHPHT